jgi:hypothetical protein
MGGRFSPNYQPELNRLSRSHQTHGAGICSKLFFPRRNKMAAACAATRVSSSAGVLSGLFHKAGGGQRPRDDGADIDRAPPRLAGRLGTANG